MRVPDGERGLTADEWADVVESARVYGYRAAVRHRGRRLAGRDPSEFDDLTHDALLAALDGLTRYDRRRGVPPGAFLRRRMAGGVDDAVRARGSLVPTPKAVKERAVLVPLADVLLPDGVQPNNVWPGDWIPARPEAPRPSRYEFRMALRRAFGVFDARTEDMLVLRFFDGLTAERIGRQFGVGRAMVWHIMSAALDTMRARQPCRERLAAALAG